MTRRPLWQTVLLYATVLFWCFIVLFPFYWLGTTSFKRQLDAIRLPKYAVPIFINCISSNWNQGNSRYSGEAARVVSAVAE